MADSELPFILEAPDMTLLPVNEIYWPPLGDHWAKYLHSLHLTKEPVLIGSLFKYFYQGSCLNVVSVSFCRLSTAGKYLQQFVGQKTNVTSLKNYPWSFPYCQSFGERDVVLKLFWIRCSNWYWYWICFRKFFLVVFTRNSEIWRPYFYIICTLFIFHNLLLIYMNDISFQVFT